MLAAKERRERKEKWIRHATMVIDTSQSGLETGALDFELLPDFLLISPPRAASFGHILMNEDFMREAIRISVERMRAGQGGPFGAVVVKDGHVIARGWNQVTTSHDPTAHAEMTAIRDACRVLGDFRLTGCELYSSCEPCPMCLGAIYWARLERLYFAAGRRDAAEAGFDDEFIYREVPLPPVDRRLPTVQLLREAAVVAFVEWRAKTDKVPY